MYCDVDFLIQNGSTFSLTKHFFSFQEHLHDEMLLWCVICQELIKLLHKYQNFDGNIFRI